MISVKNVERYIENGLNVLIQGKHGVGKTTVVEEACQNLNMKYKKYNVPTMDPSVDFVGIPNFKEDEDGRWIEFIRPKDVVEAEVIIMDEVNRGNDPVVLNAVMEIIQFRTINGTPLPNLKCIVATMNPSDGEIDYEVDSLDDAFVDRFDLVFDVKPQLSKKYLSRHLSSHTVDSLISWWKARGSDAEYIAPRRVEKIGIVFETLGDRTSFNAAFPPGKFDSAKLWNMLTSDLVADDTMMTLLSEELTAEDLKLLSPAAIASSISAMSDDTRSMSSPGVSADNLEKAMNNVANAMNSGIGHSSAKEFAPIISKMTKKQAEMMAEGWNKTKRQAFILQLREFNDIPSHVYDVLNEDPNTYGV